MPTIEALPSTTVTKGGFSQIPRNATDLDGYEEVSIYLNVQNVTNGGTTLSVVVDQAARNRDADYFSLTQWTGITAGMTSYTYKTGFSRFLRVQAQWSSGSDTSTADVEVLVVPKR